MRARRSLLVVSAAAALAAPPALATVGAGVSATPLALAAEAEPGHRYRLPLLYVVNTGTEPARYDLHIDRLSSGRGHDIPAGWIRLSPRSVELAPKAHAWVKLTLRVPTGAAGGAYLSDVVARAEPLGTKTGPVAIGAAAADRITFEVAEPGPLACFAWPGPHDADLLLLAALVLLVAVAAARRFGIQVTIGQRGRRPGG